MRIAVTIMTRIPMPGYTKTRLMAKMSGYECAVFQLASLVDTCNAVRGSGLDGQIYYTGGEATLLSGQHLFSGTPPWGLNEAARKDFAILPQQGDDLGDRMLQATRHVLTRYEGVILLGSDMPDLSPELLYEASLQLEENDLVIGPAQDGGYYLLGIKQVHLELFQNMPWGTSEVLRKTVAAAAEKKLKVALLEEKNDIDTWADVCYFYQKGRETKKLQELQAYTWIELMVQKYGL
ncbi:MAG: TIGR04282 family arsenosugar biosynthesis glycosyltransferase [Syntrophomonadaceae bacterium]|nr:TIGR04282 family arsenosugar biosynthesis glycosyltransferase [Syntrophomonadaceae bacterium]